MPPSSLILSIMSTSSPLSSLLLFFLLASVASLELTYTCPEESLDFHDRETSDDIVSIPHMFSWQECGTACSLVGTCFFWTYDTTTLYCHMSRSDHGVHYRENVISGARSCTQQDGESSTTTRPTTTAPECGDGWQQFETACYQILSSDTTLYYDLAVCREECAALGGKLASIHSTAENSFVVGLRTASRVWLGAERVDSGNFRWEDGTPWDYTNWDLGMPHSETTKCIYTGYRREEKWTDGICDYSKSLFDCLCKRTM